MRFLHDWNNISPLRQCGKEWCYVAWRQCTHDAKDLVKYVKTEGYRLTFEKCTDAEAAMMLQAMDSGPLVFQDEAPLGLIRRACKDYLSGAESIHNIRDIVCNFRSFTLLLEDVQPADVCSEIYATLFPCPRCSAPNTLQQVFHQKGVNGRELRYELTFLSFEDRHQYGGHVVRERVTLRTIHDIRDADFAPLKSRLSKLTISTNISDCIMATNSAASQRPLVAFFTVYARDVFAYLDRYDLDTSELVSFEWRQTLLKIRASIALRCLCVELVMALDGNWVIPIIYNPGLDDHEVDRRQFKVPHRCAELDSQLIQSHLRNSFVASVVVAHEWGDGMPVTGNEATRWVCEMLGGLDNCRVGELQFSRVYPTFEDIATILDGAMSRNRPQKLSMAFDSDEQLRQLFILDGFLLGGPFRDIERMEFSVAVSHGLVMPTWRHFLFLSPCIRKLRIRYEIDESTDVFGLQYVVDDIIQDFLALEQMAATDVFDLYLTANRLVYFLRQNRDSTRFDVQVTDAEWCPIGEYACEEYHFRNIDCHKELVVYTSFTERESVALCRLR